MKKVLSYQRCKSAVVKVNRSALEDKKENSEARNDTGRECVSCFGLLALFNWTI